MGAKNTPTKIEAKLADLALKDQEKSDLNDVLSKLNSFQNYLKELCIHIHKGNLRKGFVFNWTFMNDFNIQEKDFRNFCLANLNFPSNSFGTSIPSESLKPTARFLGSSTVYITLTSRPSS